VRFWLGLATGLALGAALGWLATARPWRREPAPIAARADAGPETGKPVKSKPGKRRVRRDGEAWLRASWPRRCCACSPARPT